MSRSPPADVGPSDNSSSAIAFPSLPAAVLVQAPTKSLSNSESSTSQLTSSDKLSELPHSFVPTARPVRRSFEESASSSAPDMRRLGNASLGAIIASASESSQGSLRGETPTPARGRVSFESDRGSLSNNTSPRQAPRALNSEPALHLHKSSPLASAGGLRTPRSEPAQHSRAASRKESVDSAYSRATSPLRALMDRLPDLRRVVSREEPFIAINPFRSALQWPLPIARLFSPQPREHEQLSMEGHEVECACTNIFHSPSIHATHTFLFVMLPRNIYLHLLLRLPSLYFSRVARLFEDAEVSKPDIQRMIDMCDESGPHSDAELGHGGGPDLPPYPDEWTPPHVTPTLARFKHNWETFVDQLLREWKTLNLVSALLLSALLTIFQIPAAAEDTLIRTPALLGLVCALMSLSYGCVYIVRFGTMRNMYRASRWAEEARASKTVVFWNVWVLLALPGVWLAWAMAAFCVAIVAFVWRTGAQEDPVDGGARSLNSRQMLGPRIAITAVFLLGMVYFALVIVTFTRYSRGKPRRRGRHLGHHHHHTHAHGQGQGEDGERGRGMERGTGRSESRREKEMSIGLGLTGLTGASEKEKMSPRVDEREVGKASGSTSPYVI